MPLQQINLPDQQIEFVRQSIEQGRFKDASEVVRAGLTLLQEQSVQSVADPEVVALIRQSIAEFDRGESQPARQVIAQLAADFGVELKS